MPALLWLLAGGGAAVGLLLLGMGWGKSIERGAWRAIEVRRLESRLADTRRQHAVALAYEADRAARAEAARLVARVVEDDQLMATAQGIAAQLAAKPTLALGMIRAQVKAALNSTLSETLSIEATNQRKAGRSEDFREGVAAFLKKRPPEFKGK